MIYYNENDPEVAAWLLRLIQEGVVPDGHVDTRSIRDIRAGDLDGYCQHHFFVGIGGWSAALQLTQCLGEVVELLQASGWVTPSARDHKDSIGMATESIDQSGKRRRRLDQFPRQVYNLIPGLLPDGSNAQMDGPGELNPELCLWLMGYPDEWHCCGVLAMRSFHR